MVTACAAFAAGGISASSAQAKSDIEPVSSSRIRAGEGDADEYHHVRNRNNGQCLGVLGGNPAPGTGLITWGCGPWNDHQWKFENVGGNERRIRPLHAPDSCGAVPRGTTDDSQAIIWPCEFEDHKWLIWHQYNANNDPNRPVFVIQNKVTKKCLEAVSRNGMWEVWQRTCNFGWLSQHWEVNYLT
jgi:hypothetical protein